MPNLSSSILVSGGKKEKVHTHGLMFSTIHILSLASVFNCVLYIQKSMSFVTFLSCLMVLIAFLFLLSSLAFNIYHFYYNLQIGGQSGYASIYGELPEFELKRNLNLLAPSEPSERPWETIFSGSSHSLPPLTKLCSAFLESLLEKRTAIVE